MTDRGLRPSTLWADGHRYDRPRIVTTLVRIANGCAIDLAPSRGHSRHYVTECPCSASWLSVLVEQFYNNLERHLACDAAEDASPCRQSWYGFFCYAVDVCDGACDAVEILLVYQSMNEVIVSLRGYGR